MKKITKHNFLNEKTELNFKTIVSGVLFIVLLAFDIWLDTYNKTAFFIIFSIILFIILSVSILGIIVEHKTRHLPTPYYIVEDIFIHVREKKYTLNTLIEYIIL